MTKRKHHEIIQNIEHKHCGKCNKWRTLDKFGKRGNGKYSCCKSCVNKRIKQRRKVIKEERKKARAAAPTGFLVCLRTWCTVKGLQPVDQFISDYVHIEEPTKYCLTCRDKLKEAKKRTEAPCQKVWDDWRKKHPCVICMNDPNHVHDPLLIEADHLGGKVTQCSQMSYWCHSKRGPDALQAELKKCQAVCVFHHRLTTQQRDHDNGRIQTQTCVLRKRTVINAEKHKRGCCFRCERPVKEGEECAFDFDHRDPNTKFMHKGKTRGPSDFVQLSDALFDTQWPLEQAKCDLLCANCDKLKTWASRDGYKK